MKKQNCFADLQDFLFDTEAFGCWALSILVNIIAFVGVWVYYESFGFAVFFIACLGWVVAFITVLPISLISFMFARR
ncbi:hypothetical protein AGMMS49545_01350 [Betaproteobacteria bacterium]|nr:hypothetical protein AGMMS49545_01350 [Betaproteobacteria bacterium]